MEFRVNMKEISKQVLMIFMCTDGESSEEYFFNKLHNYTNKYAKQTPWPVIPDGC